MHTSIYNGLNFYVYLITDLNPIGTEMYYIGSSHRKELQENNINPELDTYFGSSSVKHFRALQKSKSPQLERIIIKTFSSKKRCLDYEEKIQRDHDAASNPLFYNKCYANRGFSTTAESQLKTVKTKLTNVDENGLNVFERAILKSNTTRLKDIDSNGLNSYQRVGVKAKETRLNDIDDDGLNSYQRSAFKVKETKLNDIDDDGLNTNQRSAFKVKETRLNDINDGLNSYQRAGAKTCASRLNNIDDDGLNSYQRSVFKISETKLNNIDDNGLNSYERGVIKTKYTKLNDIDDSGLNSHERGAIKHIKTVNNVKWKNTTGKDAAQKRSKTLCGHKCYGFKGVEVVHTPKALAAAIKKHYGCSLSSSRIHELAKSNFKTIITRRGNSPFLQSLEDDPTGKSYHDLGFYYYEDVKL